MDVVKENMKLVGVREEDGEDRVRWRRIIQSGNLWREQLKEKEEEEDIAEFAKRVTLQSQCSSSARVSTASAK